MIKKTTLRNKSIGNKETKIIAILTKAIITIVKVAIRRMKLTVVIIMVIVVVSLWNMWSIYVIIVVVSLLF